MIDRSAHAAKHLCLGNPFFIFLTELGIIYIQASVCAAGDSAAYHRSSVYGDDVVIVA